MSIREQRHRASEKAAELAVLQVLKDNREYGITASEYDVYFGCDRSKYGQFREAQIRRAMAALVEKGYVEHITDLGVRMRRGLEILNPLN